MSSDESDCTPEFITTEANNISNDLLPEKSKETYIKAYDNFQKWKSTKGVKSISEPVLLVYFQHLSCTQKSSSLWCTYSMLRSTISMKHNIDIKTYAKLLAFLKRKSEGHQSKKSKVFTPMNVETFLNEAPDHSYLAVKVALIIGVNGACRCQEMVNMKVQDIEKHSEELLLIKLPDTKTKRERSFVIRGAYVKVVEKYQALRPPNINTNRFFVAFSSGKCTRQVIGKNKISAMPKEIAKYLGLPNIELYTGHCFRRTSATLLADAGADITQIKRHGGWKSDTVAEGYIENSVQNKSKISCKIGNSITLKTSSDSFSPQPSTSHHHIPSFPEPHTPPSPTFTTQNAPLQIQDSEALTSNTQINSTSTSINVPNKNVTLSLHNWTNVSNVTINFN